MCWVSELLDSSQKEMLTNYKHFLLGTDSVNKMHAKIVMLQSGMCYIFCYFAHDVYTYMYAHSPTDYRLDVEKLKKTYKQLQWQLHPDKFVKRSQVTSYMTTSQKITIASFSKFSLCDR